MTDKKAKEQIKELKENMKSRENWAIFLGAGASADSGFPTMRKLTEIALEKIKNDKKYLLIEEIISVLENHKKERINIEDILNVCYQLMTLIKDKKDIEIKYRNIQNITEGQINDSILKIKEVCFEECLKDYNLDNQYKFIKFWLSGTREIDIFTTNWDFLVEKASDKLIKLEDEDIRCIDGFKGVYSKTLDLSLFGEETNVNKKYVKRINLFKLHGSVNWVLDNEKIVMSCDGNAVDKRLVMIFPTPQKYKEILGFPYIELLRIFSNIIENKCKYLLVIGYRFQDEHINSIIKQALKNPSFNIYVVDPEISTSHLSSIFGEHTQIREPINFKFKEFIEKISSEVAE